MANSKSKRVYRITSVNLSKAAANTDDPSKLVELESRYERLSNAQATAVKSARMAVEAQAQAEIDARKLQQENAKFLIFAGELDRTVATEGIWPTPAFKNESGDVILETPYSTRDARTATRVMHSKLADEAKQLSERFGGLFEEEEHNEEEDKE